MYIKEENNKLIIYEVVLDMEKLEEIKKEFIFNHSKVTTHTEKESLRQISRIEYYDKYMIYPISSVYVGRHDTCDFYGTVYDLYDNTYKKYKYPKLVIYINEFLKGDFSNLPKLKELLIQRKIYRLNDENRDEILNLLSYKDYIKKIIKCIKIEIVKEKEINSLSDLIDLLSIVDDEKLQKNLNNISKKIKNDEKSLSYLMEV